jgi:hypothetical protein
MLIVAQLSQSARATHVRDRKPAVLAIGIKDDDPIAHVDQKDDVIEIRNPLRPRRVWE